MGHKNPITEEERCKGIKTDGEQCSRKHNSESDYCKSHLKLVNRKKKNVTIQQHDNLKLEVVETTSNKLDKIELTDNREINTEQTSQIYIPKKRGRKPKIIPDTRINDSETYIPVNYIIINGEKYLIDQNYNIYSNDIENPVFIGCKTIHGIVN